MIRRIIVRTEPSSLDWILVIIFNGELGLVIKVSHEDLHRVEFTRCQILHYQSGIAVQQKFHVVQGYNGE